MLVFKYTKTDGAEYISHLDALRHLSKIMRRADIDITKSKGFNPHMHIYMNAPMGVGIKSLCEYCFVDTQESAQTFIKKFNEFSINGIVCLSCVDVEKKVNVAGAITRAKYEIEGVLPFDENLILNSENFIVTDKKGNDKNLRSRIYSLENSNGVTTAVLGFGNDTLRADVFGAKLVSLFGGEIKSITKTEVFAGDEPFDEYVRKFGL